MDLKWATLAISLIALSSCGDKDAKDDKAKQAVKEAVTREFQYYDSAKQKLGEAKKQEEQRRDQEKQLE
jgi:hypothetical protein